MAIVFVNDEPIEIGNRHLNCVQAASLADTEIPHYCYHPSLTVVASCRMCLVEVGEVKDGKVTMQPKVVPGCQTPVKDGTVIVTGDYQAKRKPSSDPLLYDANYKPGERAKKSQADTLEGILLNHPLDCPVCDKAGECKLQDYSYEYGHGESRMIDVKNTPPNKPDISSKITLFTDRCIMCTRCVRFTREISGTSELTVTNRGHHAEIDIFPGRPLENKLSGNVVDLCPVGALGSKDFLYTQRVWYMKSTDGVCNRCSTGCSIYTDVNKGIVFRLRARENPDVNGHFICDAGRWGYHYTNAADRLRKPTLNGHVTNWSQLFPALRADLTEAAESGMIVALSPYLTVEEAYLFAFAFKQMGKNVQLVLGPVPVVGMDDSYPKDVHGKPIEPVKFTIRAEKCPNRIGIEKILTHFSSQVVHLSDIVAATDKPVAFFGGYPDSSFGMFGIQHMPKQVLLASDLFANTWTTSAKYVLPATTVFEKDGTYLNHAGFSQTFSRTVPPPREVRTELQLAYDLAQRRGLVQGVQIRREIAESIDDFKDLPIDSPSKSSLRTELTIV